MAQRSVEGISHQTVAHGVQAGQPRLAHTFAADRESPFMKAGYGKTVRPVCAADEASSSLGASSDPTVRKRGNARGAKGAGHRRELGSTGSYREEPKCSAPLHKRTPRRTPLVRAFAM